MIMRVCFRIYILIYLDYLFKEEHSIFIYNQNIIIPEFYLNLI